MEFRYGRQLVFKMSEGFKGWFCERCCWSVRLPPLGPERDATATGVQQMFEAHDCEAFAQQNWRSKPGDSPAIPDGSPNF